MGKKCKSLDECKTRADFLRYAEHHPQAEIVQGGNHTKVKGPKGITVIGRHDLSYELQPASRHGLRKQFVAIGLGILSLLIVATMFVF